MTHPTAEMRVVLDRVLQETQMPLLKGEAHPSSPSAEVDSRASDGQHYETGWRQFGLPMGRPQNSRVSVGESQAADSSADGATIEDSTPTHGAATDHRANESPAESHRDSDEGTSTALRFRPPRFVQGDEEVEAECDAEPVSEIEAPESDAADVDESCGLPEVYSEIAPSENSEPVTNADPPALPAESEAPATISNPSANDEPDLLDKSQEANAPSTELRLGTPAGENAEKRLTIGPARSAPPVIALRRR